ncbi:MAG: phosphoribosylaminoimidazolesuccinocarboxamide synthase [Actinomycetota bacterium]
MEIFGWKHFYSGKVRDLYTSEDTSKSDLILLVASDRISAFDNILDPAITGKGENLTAVSNFWFDLLDVPNHRVVSEKIPEEVMGRGTIAKKLKMFPVECVVRGYVSGSGFKEYAQSGMISGIKLPAGLKEGDRLSSPIFTPAYKAELGEHDENISFEKVIELVGEGNADKLRELSLSIFARASEVAEKAGLILADTKFEFGVDGESGEIVLADEVLTPDSSRYWDKAAYSLGRLESFDKQLIRNWLLERWDPQSGTKPPRLSDEIVARSSERYAELREKLLGATK